MLCWPRFYFCVACLKASQRNQGSDMWLKDVDLQIDVGTLTPTSRENQHSSVSKLWNNRRKQWRRHSPRRSRHTSSYFFPLNVHYQHCNLSVRQFQALVVLCCVVELCVCVCVYVCEQILADGACFCGLLKTLNWPMTFSQCEGILLIL